MALITRFEGEHDFLSNFYPAKVKWEGLVYPTVEHAFQAAKTFEHDSRRYIAGVRSPGGAKRAGRTVKLRPDWEDVKVGVMRALVTQKFTVHEDLRRELLDTGHASLVEGNTWGDTFWGQSGGHGENWLGRILMDVRDELRRLAGDPASAPASLFETGDGNSAGGADPERKEGGVASSAEHPE